MFKKVAVAALVAAAVTIPAAAALASGPKVTEEVAKTIRTTLGAQGYTVGKIKTEDGLYEAYAKKDGKKYEIFLNDKMEIVRKEED